MSTCTRLRPCPSRRSPSVPRMRPSSARSSTFGSPIRLATFSSLTTASSSARVSDQRSRPSVSSASLNAASAYGRATVMSSAIYRLQLVLHAREQIRVLAVVDFAAQDLLGARDGELCDVRAQRLARTRDFLLDFGLGA